MSSNLTFKLCATLHLKSYIKNQLKRSHYLTWLVSALLLISAIRSDFFKLMTPVNLINLMILIYIFLGSTLSVICFTHYCKVNFRFKKECFSFYNEVKKLNRNFLKDYNSLCTLEPQPHAHEKVQLFETLIYLEMDQQKILVAKIKAWSFFDSFELTVVGKNDELISHRGSIGSSDWESDLYNYIKSLINVTYTY